MRSVLGLVCRWVLPVAWDTRGRFHVPGAVPHLQVGSRLVWPPFTGRPARREISSECDAAASRTLPLGNVVQVTNLRNGARARADNDRGHYSGFRPRLQRRGGTQPRYTAPDDAVAVEGRPARHEAWREAYFAARRLPERLARSPLIAGSRRTRSVACTMGIHPRPRRAVRKRRSRGSRRPIAASRVRRRARSVSKRAPVRRANGPRSPGPVLRITCHYSS